MAKINLSPYTVKIRNKHSNNEEDIYNLFGTNISLYEVISDISLKFKQKPFKQPKNHKALKFENKINTYTDNRVKVLQDILFYGEYGRLMKLNIDKDGYLLVGLTKNGITHAFKTHRLVAQHFPRPGCVWDPSLTVDHEDEDKQNNREDNLRQCTRKQNSRYYFDKRPHSSKYRYVRFCQQSKNWRVDMNIKSKSYY